jgi:hypothetical protein
MSDVGSSPPRSPAAADTPTADPSLALRLSLKQALNVVQRQAAEIRRLKKSYGVLANQGEAEEEYLTNKLMKQMQQLKREKETLAMPVSPAAPPYPPRAIIKHARPPLGTSLPFPVC